MLDKSVAIAFLLEHEAKTQEERENYVQLNLEEVLSWKGDVYKDKAYFKSKRYKWVGKYFLKEIKKYYDIKVDYLVLAEKIMSQKNQNKKPYEEKSREEKSKERIENERWKIEVSSKIDMVRLEGRFNREQLLKNLLESQRKKIMESDLADEQKTKEIEDLEDFINREKAREE